MDGATSGCLATCPLLPEGPDHQATSSVTIKMPQKGVSQRTKDRNVRKEGKSPLAHSSAGTQLRSRASLGCCKTLVQPTNSSLGPKTPRDQEAIPTR